MCTFRLIILGVGIVGAVMMAPFSATPSHAKQCSAERPANARSYWSYRLIDGRKCWYEGRPMLSKSLLHWATSPTTKAASVKSNVTPAGQRSLLDAQASLPASAASKPGSEVKRDVADASLAPGFERSLTPDHLRAWASGMAAITAEPILTIMDRWPDAELPQHQRETRPVQAPSLTTPRLILMVAIIFAALFSVLIPFMFHRGAAARNLRAPAWWIGFAASGKAVLFEVLARASSAFDRSRAQNSARQGAATRRTW